MIWPNRAARNHEFRMDVSSDYTRSVTGFSVTAVHTLAITWGQSIAPATHGIRLTVTNTVDSSEPATGEAPAYEVRLETPWDSDQVYTGAGWLGSGGSPYATLLQVDGLALEVVDCNGGTISFDELRLILAGATVYTLGAQSDAFLGYDLRENNVRLTVAPVVSPPPLEGGPPVCLSDPHDLEASAGIGGPDGAGAGGGYRYWVDGAWRYDLVLFDGYPPPDPGSVSGCPACDCQVGPPVPGLYAARPALTDSWYAELAAIARDRLDVSLLGRYECACVGGPGGGTWIWDVYDQVWDYRKEGLWADVAPKNKGVSETDREAGAECTCAEQAGFTTVSETSDDGDTHARYRGDEYAIAAENYCCDEVQTGVCNIGGGGHPPTCEDCSGLTDPAYFCWYEAYTEISQPSEPACEDGLDANPWNFHLDYDHYHRTSVESGNVWYRQADYGLPPFDQAVVALSSGKDSFPRMAVDQLTQRMHLVWCREDPAGTFATKLAVSDDEGATWSGPEDVITDGRFPTVACSRDGTVVIMAFVYDSGTSGPGTVYMRARKLGEASFSAAVQIKDSGGTPIAFAEDTFHVSQAFDPQHTWVLAARPSGSSDVREYLSYDDCQTFEIV